MVTLPEIYKKVDSYLSLPDKDVIKLLMAFAISCKLPVAEPPWLFLASGSSTGKTQLVVLLELVNGYTAVDDLTGNALMSGMKRNDTNASLLHRLPKSGAFLVFSDFTTMLSKQKEELSKILGQLRVVFDGKVTRHTGGQVETDVWDGKVGLLAASTTALYTKTEEYAEVGQRMIIYHMPQPGNREVGKFRFSHAKTDRKALRIDIQKSIKEYLGQIELPGTMSELPEFDEQTQADIIDIGHLAVTARSPVTRNKFSREKEQESREDPEGIGRVQGQLMTLAYGLMLQNPDKQLNDSDRRLLYKIGLDCIDPRKRAVLQTLTEYSMGGDIDQIATSIVYPNSVTLRFVEDLFSLRMLTRDRKHVGQSSTYVYRLKDEFKDIMQRFEGIKPENKALPTEGEDPAMTAPVDPNLVEVLSLDDSLTPQQLGF